MCHFLLQPSVYYSDASVIIMTLWPGILRDLAVAVSLGFSKFVPLPGPDILDKRSREEYS